MASSSSSFVKKTNSKKKLDGVSSNSSYLFYYNFVQFLGWAYILSLVIIFYANSERATKRLWDFVKVPVIIFQLGSLLEIVHTLVGVVKSGVVVTAAQILFRLLNVFCVLQVMPPHLDSIGVTMTVIAWSSAEIIRYLFYVFKEKNSSPFFIVWLRYTSFIVLIPLGLGGELISLYVVQGYVADNERYTFTVPYIDINLSYRIFYLLFFPLLVRGFFLVYNHMFNLRKKALKGSSDSAK